METKTKRRGRRKAWQVSSTINKTDGSVCVFSMVYNGKEAWLKSKTFYGYNQKKARLLFIEETINEGLKLAPVR